MKPPEDRVARERARRWWHDRRRIGSIDRAAAFIEDVGFALLFPRRGLQAPSLWQATSDREFVSLPEDWGPDASRVWGWKDELPERKLAWYGRFLFGRPSFLSPAMLSLLYPRAGRPDDFRDDPTIDGDARRIAELLLSSGPMPSATLREATGLQGKRGPLFERAVTKLARSLVVTSAGTEEMDQGWPSSVLDLTARRFKVARRPADAPRTATLRFLETMVAAKPNELARAFGWTLAVARTRLDHAVFRHDATRAGSQYLKA